MRVLVCGTRSYFNETFMRSVLEKLGKDTVIIEGEARGADSQARAVAESLGLVVEKYPAEWNKYGRSAGFVRNTQMLREGHPDEVYAFFEDLKAYEKSKGTKNMIAQARRIFIPVTIFISGNALILDEFYIWLERAKKEV
jgi:hypothetical protein